MGLIVRHSGAPFADGEVLSAGTEGSPDGLELDIAAFYAEFNGFVDDVNIKTAAGISGTKLLISSLAAAKFASNSLDATVLLDDSIPDVKVGAGAVTIAKIKANALSSVEEKTDGTAQFIDQTEFEELINNNIVSTEGSGAVLVSWYARLLSFPDSSDGLPGNSQFRIKRANNVLQATSNAVRHFGQVDVETSISMTFLDTARPGGVSVEYSVEALQASGSDRTIVDTITLHLVNLGA